MKITLPTKITKNDLLVLPFYEGKNPKPKIDPAIENQHHPDFEGKLSENVMIYQKDKVSPRILLVGLGKKAEENAETWRRAGGSVAKALKKSFQTIALLPPKEDVTLVSAFTEGMLLAHYQYEETLSDASRKLTPIKELLLIIQDKTARKELPTKLEEVQKISDAIHTVRNLVNAPSNLMGPSHLVRKATSLMGSRRVKVKTLNEPQLKKLKMGCLLGVGKGAQEKPRLITLEYKHKPKNKKPIILIGKGVCFDAGGLNLKPRQLEEMKYDMAGAATILGVFKLLSQSKLPLHVIGLTPLAENLVDSKSYKPGDILTAYDGTTVEIKNTDAEGRLILADTIAYAVKKYKPSAIIDVATLTGAAITALGYDISALVTNNAPLAQDIKSSAELVDEKIWELPLDPDYKKEIKSDIADIQNYTGKTGAGTIMGGAFLEHFVKDTPWAHIDMGGSAYTGEPKPYYPKGATGRVVRTLWQYLKTQAGL